MVSEAIEALRKRQQAEQEAPVAAPAPPAPPPLAPAGAVPVAPTLTLDLLPSAAPALTTPAFLPGQFRPLGPVAKAVDVGVRATEVAAATVTRAAGLALRTVTATTEAVFSLADAFLPSGVEGNPALRALSAEARSILFSPPTSLEDLGAKLLRLSQLSADRPWFQQLGIDWLVLSPNPRTLFKLLGRAAPVRRQAGALARATELGEPPPAIAAARAEGVKPPLSGAEVRKLQFQKAEAEAVAVEAKTLAAPERTIAETAEEMGRIADEPVVRVPAVPQKRSIEELRKAGEIVPPGGPTVRSIEQSIEETLRDSKVLRRVEEKAHRVFNDLDDFSFQEKGFLEDLIPEKEFSEMRFGDIQEAVRVELAKNERLLTSQRARLEARRGLDVEAEAEAIERGIERIGLTESTVGETVEMMGRIADPTPLPAIPARPLPTNRPRTLTDMNRDALGMRALTPEQRAAVMDAAKPIPETELIYKHRPYAEHADNLLGPDTPINARLRQIPGAKKIVALIDRAQMVRDEPIPMIGIIRDIFVEIETARVKLATLRWGHDAQEVFNFRLTGSFAERELGRGIWRAEDAVPKKARPADLRGTIDDLIEHPEMYNLTADQFRVLRAGQNMMNQMLRDAQRAGVDVVELGEAYWHRIVIGGPRETISGTFVRQQLGSRKGYTYQRAFREVDEGIVVLKEKGYRYETSPFLRMNARLEAGVQTIADAMARREIAKLPGVQRPLERLQAQFPATIEGVKEARAARDVAKKAYLGDETPGNYLALRQSEANYVVAQRELGVARKGAAQPGLGELRLPNGRIAPRELVEEIRRSVTLPELQMGRGPLAYYTTETFRMLRTMKTTLDLAAGYIQGQVLFWRNNRAWWTAQRAAVVSLVDDPLPYIAKNYDLMDEGIRMGAVIAPTEFLFATRGFASLPLKIPLASIPLRASNRAFEWFIVTGQTELFRAAKATGVGMEELVQMGKAIRNTMGTESYAILGIRPNQQALEALTAFAARFFRANAGLIVRSFQPGAAGQYARRSMGSLLAGGLTFTVGINAAQGKKTNLTDPYAPDWNQFVIGNTYHNVYGPFYPFLRTIARMSHSLAEGDPAKAARELGRFASSKAGLPIRAVDMAAQIMVTGSSRTFEGEVIARDPISLSKGLFSEFVVAIAPAEIVRGLSEGRPEAILEIIGLTGRASPYARMDILFQRDKELNPEQKSYRDASPQQRKIMVERHTELAVQMLQTARGKYGEVQRQWAEIDAKYFAQEEALSEEFRRETISHAAFRDRYGDIQGEKAAERARANATSGLFQPDRPLPDDPNDRAVAQYYEAQRQAGSESGIYNFEKAERLLRELQSLWTQGQADYVEENTGLGTHPPLIVEYRHAVELLGEYFDVPELVILDPNLLDEYRRRADIEKKSLRLRAAIEKVGKRRESVLRQYPWMKELLEKWF